MPEDETHSYNFKRLKEYCDEKCVIMVIITMRIFQKQKWKEFNKCNALLWNLQNVKQEK